MTMKMPPKVHAAVIDLPDVEDPESIAWVAANASLELLRKVSAENRGSVTLDRVAIVRPQVMSNLEGFLMLGRSPHALMITCRVESPPAAEEKSAEPTG
jgi:hypothetical protein